MILNRRFNEALTYAADVHREQQRKGTSIPYVSHLLGVCSLVLEYGGDEDQAIAGLLHDAVEDQGGAPRLADIRGRFGGRVADIVSACTDADTHPKPPWRERKERYIAALAEHASEVWLVSCADKLYNARAILGDYREIGDELWQRFRGGKAGTLWYYRALANEFNHLKPGPIARELEGTVATLEALVEQPVSEPG
jgi:GTP pyrophosphokinase